MRRRRARPRGLLLGGLWLASGVAGAQVTERVSVASSGEQGTAGSSMQDQGRQISDDGRFVVFAAEAPNLVPGDSNGVSDVFLRDRIARTTERISSTNAGAQANGASGHYGVAMTPDARFVAFESVATNLVFADTNGVRDVFLRDRQAGTTVRMSRATGGAQADADCYSPVISRDGRFVAFHGAATTLVPGDANGRNDVFVRDVAAGTILLASVGLGGAPADHHSGSASLSADGRWIAFGSAASNLVPGDTNGVIDVFVRDLAAGTTERVSVSTAGAQADQFSAIASITDDARYVTFASSATNLVPGDTNGFVDVFLRDRIGGTTERVSVATGGAQGDNGSGEGFASEDGRFVAFSSWSRNLAPVSAFGGLNVFARDRQLGTTVLLSLGADGEPLDGPFCTLGGISADGRFVGFASPDRGFVPGDSNAEYDVFLRDRTAAGFEIACEPGVGGVVPCPCANPPSAPGLGCDNSTQTGGASLSAAGIAYLSLDSLVFTTSGTTASALSVFFQSASPAAAGILFGQGVRCADGPLRRLYVKSASHGSATAPDLAAGDPTVSARSAALGDAIAPGQSRWYFVAYRDPVVLGGCDAWRTLNATATGRVGWWP